MTAPVLEIEGLRGGPPGMEILKGIGVSVGAGEVHALMGPNGSGKSTLAHCVMGRPGYEVTAGAVNVNGTDVLTLPVHEKARAGLFVGHQYPIEVAGVSNRDFLAEVALALGRDADIDALAAAFEIPTELLDRALNQDLSGGEKKRNELLQLALIRPEVAVLDEIDSGLDVDALRSVAAGVERLTHDGLSVLLITHYTRILEYLHADFVHVMLDGDIVESGGPELADVLEAEGYEHYTV
jgi:Fe-S cluster assembly ATP-binding protein